MTHSAENDAAFRVDKDGTLRFRNGVACGAVLQEVDGYYVWYPSAGSGFWESAHLRKIADLLDRMNAEWDAVIKSDPRVTPPGEGDE